MIINPGSAHFNAANGAALVSYSNYPAAGITVSSLSNNPAKVTS